MNDLISREALKKHKVYSKERHEYVVPVYNIDNAPSVEKPIRGIAKVGKNGEIEIELINPQSELSVKVWELYEKYQPHLATHVIDFGDELKELLGKYQKGGEK